MMHTSQTANLFALANLEGEALTLKALITSDAAHNLAAVRERCTIVTDKVHAMYKQDGIAGALACEILESIASAVTSVAPSYWQKSFPDDLSYLFDEELISHLVDEGQQEIEPETDTGWFLNGRTYYGGCIAPGDKLEDYKTECSCPECDEPAIDTQYERVEGGSLNSYNRILCRHCGFYEDSGED